MYFTTADNSKFIHLTAGLIGSFRTQLFIVTFPIAFESNAYSAPPCMRADVTFQLIWMNAVISRWSSWDSVIFYSSVLIITVLISFFFLCMFDSRRDNYSWCLWFFSDIIIREVWWWRYFYSSDCSWFRDAPYSQTLSSFSHLWYSMIFSMSDQPVSPLCKLWNLGNVKSLTQWN